MFHVEPCMELGLEFRLQAVLAQRSKYFADPEDGLKAELQTGGLHRA